MLADWPFAEPENVAAFTLKRIVRGESTILQVFHEGENGRWQFLDGEDFTVPDIHVIGLGEMSRLDPSIVALACLPLGWAAERSSPEQPWRRSPDDRDAESGGSTLATDCDVAKVETISDEGQRLYKIRTNAYYLFFCGSIADGSQVLMTGCDRDKSLILYKFDSDGVLRGIGKKPWDRLKGVKFHDEDTDTWVEVPEPFVRWQAELGFVPKAIRVRKFFDRGHGIGIEDEPDSYRAFLADPKGFMERYPGEDIDDWRRQVDEWRRHGSFVFQCGNDYNCDREGRVESS